MKTRKAFLLACAAFVIGVSPVAASDTFSILSFDNGYAPAFNLSSGNLAVASMFSFNLRISDPLSVGFVFLDGDNTVLPDYRMLRLSYQFMERIRLNIALGTVTAASTAPAVAVGSLVSGMGFDMIAFKRKFQDTLATEFKVQIDYIFTPTVAAAGLTGGNLFFGLAFSVGI